MFKAAFFCLFISSLASAQEVVSLKHQVFTPTAFGIKSRTVDIKDAEAVLKAIKQFQMQNPKAKIEKIEILTCTSDYQLPQASITQKKVDEHLKLAQERHEMIMSEVKKAHPQVEGRFGVCGLEFDRKDLNDRFVTMQSGKVYEDRFNLLLTNEEFVKKLKEEALIEDPKILKQNYPTPFLAKYKPFQGVRISISASLNDHQIKARKEESKGAKQE